MKICLILNCLKSDDITHNTTTSMHQQVGLPCTLKNDILDSQLIACCKLATTLVRQMWRHNYVIASNEYLISTLPESTIPWLYWLQFLFKSTNNSWRYERKLVFSEHSIQWIYIMQTLYWSTTNIQQHQVCSWPGRGSRRLSSSQSHPWDWFDQETITMWTSPTHLTDNSVTWNRSYHPLYTVDNTHSLLSCELHARMRSKHTYIPQVIDNVSHCYSENYAGLSLEHDLQSTFTS